MGEGNRTSSECCVIQAAEEQQDKQRINSDEQTGVQFALIRKYEIVKQKLAKADLINPWASTPVQEYIPEGKKILSMIMGFLKKYVFLPNESQYLLLALWVIQTHLYKCFEEVGYLYIHSPEPQSGKTRALEVLDVLVYNSSNVLISPTQAVLFRSADDATILLDEADTYTNMEELHAILNAGYRVGGTVKRNDQGKDRKYVMNEYPVFGPKALAGIGTGVLPLTTKDRTFMIQIMRQTKAERREKFRRQNKKEGKSLAKDIQQWAAKNKDEIAAVYERDDFPYLDDFQDRTIEISTPLAAILETALKDNAKLRIAISVLLEALATTRGEQGSPTRDHVILKGLARLSQQENPLCGTATELAQRLVGDIPDILDFEITKILRMYGFITKSVRLSGDNYPQKRYQLSHEELENYIRRYVNQPEEADRKEELAKRQ